MRSRTARFAVVHGIEQARKALASFRAGVVVKADGLAAGKGVVVCDDAAAAETVLRDWYATNTIPGGGHDVVLEERMTGRELSVFAVADGRAMVPIAAACDYKRAGDDDRGPNTGGMGAYSPPAGFPDDALDVVRETIVAPTLRGLLAEGEEYRGVLYVGLMWTPDGPRVVEFNARFGDPETQVLMPRVTGDFARFLASAAEGALELDAARFSADACCRRHARDGSLSVRKHQADRPPGRARLPPNVAAFWGTSTRAGDRVASPGGRVLTVTATAATIEAARTLAYVAIDGLKSQFPTGTPLAYVPISRGVYNRTNVIDVVARDAVCERKRSGPDAGFCARCEVVPAAKRGAGTLHLKLPVPSTASKLRALGTEGGWDVRESNGVVAVEIPAGGLIAYSRAFLERFTSVERESIRALFVEHGNAPAMADYLEADTLQRFIARSRLDDVACALRGDMLSAAFQPILETESLAIFAHEGLVRLSPESGIAGPADLFRIARDTDTLPVADLAARRTIISAAAAQPFAGTYSSTSCHRRSTTRVRACARRSRCSTSWRSPTTAWCSRWWRATRSSTYRTCSRRSDFYRRAGFRVALDDVGAGFASLNLLHALKPDFIKLDLELVRDVDHDAFQGDAGVEADRSRPRSRRGRHRRRRRDEGRVVVAARPGATYVQGFYFARPAHDMHTGSDARGRDVLAARRIERVRVRQRPTGKRPPSWFWRRRICACTKSKTTVKWRRKSLPKSPSASQ